MERKIFREFFVFIFPSFIVFTTNSLVLILWLSVCVLFNAKRVSGAKRCPAISFPKVFSVLHLYYIQTLFGSLPQKINHFPGMSEICRKDLLARNMNRLQRLFPKEYNVFPKSWTLPADYGEFQVRMERHPRHVVALGLA